MPQIHSLVDTEERLHPASQALMTDRWRGHVDPGVGVGDDGRADALLDVGALPPRPPRSIPGATMPQIHSLVDTEERLHPASQALMTDRWRGHVDHQGSLGKGCWMG